ncbi:hypothetical protein BV25DRAFT_1827763 [Artomyces pyxidatus]|uniref:Uncharacterized protein n=1 Tax=Artomyces pyxidatus TaxID=48021 RepID=A0ACB8SXE1_9AGAM|nr:hypothetical protein BV25DRAFT_1827763 [Artomyces pyxidatus]
MDPFEVRMQFLSLLRRIGPSQQSIQKVVGYSLKFYAQCGEDLWDCIVEECQKGSVNNRINILYFIDSLCEASLLAKSHPAALKGVSANSSFYVDYVSRDLGTIVESVVPEGRQGRPNVMSAKQVLEDWRSKRVIDPQKIDDTLAALAQRHGGGESPPLSLPSPLAAARPTPLPELLPRQEVFTRIEEDRERHKRLRERRWVQPVSRGPLPPLMSFLPLADDGNGEDSAIDIEFENEWETTSDWNEDDDDAVGEENDLCYPGEGETPMDLS